MGKTAEFIDQNINDKIIILTGEMTPYYVNKVEATANLSFLLGIMFSLEEN